MALMLPNEFPAGEMRLGERIQYNSLGKLDETEAISEAWGKCTYPMARVR
jgi:hypothetical protein